MISARRNIPRAATLKPELLSRPLVFDNIDQQNAYSAITMFSKEVESFLERRGHVESANFVCLVRKWHSACDTRGLCTDLRVTCLHNMFVFLTKYMSFNCFPFPLTGRYWRKMPIQTYEALLQNICTRIQLYDIAFNETYNNRAISTLTNDSFFSDMERLDKESRAYPKACNIPKIFGRVVKLNYFKHLPEKNWFLTATHKGTYPKHLAEVHQVLWKMMMDITRIISLTFQISAIVNVYADVTYQEGHNRCVSQVASVNFTEWMNHAFFLKSVLAINLNQSQYMIL